MKEELKKLGVEITVKENEIIIPKSVLKKPSETLCGHNDHRIVMASAVASIISRNKVTVTDAQAINKSYPNFFEDFKKLGGNVNVINNR